MQRNLLHHREEFKPYEYPEVTQFIQMIKSNDWVHSEINFEFDVFTYHNKLTSVEKSAIKNALKAISQIEVDVKLFWGKLYNYFPKPEINGVGATFAESEWRHSEAYAQLLEVLGITDYKEFLKDPRIQQRLKGLRVSMEGTSVMSKALAIAIFTCYTENTSLFALFSIPAFFSREKGVLRNTANMISWSAVDEQIHANFGVWLFNQLVKENPEILTPAFKDTLYANAREAIRVEGLVLDKVFEAGEVPGLEKVKLLNYMKSRINKSLADMHLDAIFEVDEKLLGEHAWFERRVFGHKNPDFFVVRPTDYTLHEIEEDIFD